MTLKQWYLKYFKSPFSLLILLMVCLQVIYFVYSIYAKEKQLYEGAKKVSTLGLLGVKEKHRVIIEGVIGMAITNLNAETSLLCKRDKDIFVAGNIS